MKRPSASSPFVLIHPNNLGNFFSVSAEVTLNGGLESGSPPKMPLCSKFRNYSNLPRRISMNPTGAMVSCFLKGGVSLRHAGWFFFPCWVFFPQMGMAVSGFASSLLSLVLDVLEEEKKLQLVKVTYFDDDRKVVSDEWPGKLVVPSTLRLHLPLLWKHQTLRS